MDKTKMTKEEKKLEGKRKWSIFKRLLTDAKPIKWGLALSAILSLIVVGCNLISPTILGKIIDTINGYGLSLERGEPAVMDFSAIGIYSLVLLGVYGVNWLFSTGKMVLMNNIVSKYFTCATRIKMSDKIQRLPVSYIDKTKKGEVISRMTNDVSVMGNSVHNFIEVLISGFLNIVGIAILMIKINPVLAVVVLLIIPISIVISAGMSKRCEQHFDKVQENGGKLYSLMEESYAGFKTIKAYNLENDQIAKQEDILTKQKEALFNGYYLGDVVQPIIAFTNSVAYVLICMLGGYYAITGVLSVGDVVAVILYSKQLSSPLEQIANGLSTLQRVFASSKRVYEVLDEKEMESETGKAPVEINGNVEFENVAFSYDKERPLIENLNISVKKGQKVAIVGPTGGGKTTIVNLLMRFYEIQQGDIKVEGKSIYELSKENLHEQISMVLQDTWLFSGTIYDNVAYGKENATREEVEEACKHAYIDHYIRTLDKGYETEIDEDSSNISTGQKQLLTIARAFMSKKKILILDEATSNVDTRTEVLIQKAMNKLMKDTTCFVIAHRLSTIVDADQIVVVNEGKIVEIGKHQELLAKDGFYAEIYNSQYSLLKAV